MEGGTTPSCDRQSVITDWVRCKLRSIYVGKASEGADGRVELDVYEWRMA